MSRLSMTFERGPGEDGNELSTSPECRGRRHRPGPKMDIKEQSWGSTPSRASRQLRSGWIKHWTTMRTKQRPRTGADVLCPDSTVSSAGLGRGYGGLDWTRSAAHRRYISFGRVKLGQRTSWREQDSLREDSAASSDRLAGAAEERRGVPATARTGWGGLSGARTTQRLRKGWDGDTEEPDRIGWCALG